MIKINYKKEYICRLCLKVANNGFQSIDDTIKHLFDILLLKLDLDLTRDPIICQDCAELTKKCLNFKSLCIDREEILLSFSVGGRKSRQSIQFICAEKEQVVITNDEDTDICRFCMSPLKINNYMPLSTLLNETIFEMITKYMPEMDFNVPEDAIICTTCIKYVEGYSQLVLNCLDTETKIKAYCKEDKSNNKEITNLDSVLHFLCKDIAEYPVDYQIYKIKQDLNGTEYTEDIYPEEYSGIIKQEKLDIKDEEMNLNESCYKNQSEITKPHLLIDKDVSEIKMYKCTLCGYDSKRKRDLKRHMLVHQDISEINMFKCAVCPYEFKRKVYFENHMVRHKGSSKVEIFKCALCAYEGKRKAHLKSHMLVHKDVSEIRMYKCALCAHETKRKTDLERHMLVHKDVSELVMFKCSLCDFETKHRDYIKNHMLVHKDVSEIRMYNCASCAYKTKRKRDLKRHILVHKYVSEKKMYECSLCSYESKRKFYFDNHMLRHKGSSKVE